jgi:hypothetical protein
MITKEEILIPDCRPGTGCSRKENSEDREKNCVSEEKRYSFSFGMQNVHTGLFTTEAYIFQWDFSV